MPPRRAPLLLGLAATAVGAAVAFGLLRGPAPVEPDGRPNFLIIDIDTLRADRVGATRGGVAVTPNLDALSARSARFTHAYSQSGWTMPALVSNLTGTLPVVFSKVEGQVSWRPPNARDLPEILGLYGYTTIAFWGNTIPGMMSGAVSDTFQVAKRVEGSFAPAPPTHEVIAFLEQAPKEPFFAYVHEIDLHNPQSFLAGPEGIPFDHPAMPKDEPFYRNAYTQVLKTSGEAAARDAMTSRYDGVLHLYDRAIGRVLAVLEERGLADHTVVVVTADHGEDFFEHSVMEHGLLHDTTLHVPLIVYDPTGSARTVDTMVQSVDLAPTVLARAGVPIDRTMDGRSLLDLIGVPGVAVSGGAAPAESYVERPVFSLSEPCHVSLRTRTHKLILRDKRPPTHVMRPAGGGNAVIVPLSTFAAAHGPDLPLADCSSMRVLGTAGQPEARGPSPDELVLELYDLVADPTEQINLVAEQPEVAAGLLAPLLHTVASRREAVAGATPSAMTPEQIKALKDNGYWELVQPGSAPSTPSGAPSAAP
ncbi:MAG: sulfatase [Myxococcota bacterium]